MKSLIRYYWWVPFWVCFLAVGIITGNPLFTLGSTIFPILNLLTS